MTHSVHVVVRNRQGQSQESRGLGPATPHSCTSVARSGAPERDCGIGSRLGHRPSVLGGTRGVWSDAPSLSSSVKSLMSSWSRVAASGSTFARRVSSVPPQPPHTASPRRGDGGARRDLAGWWLRKGTGVSDNGPCSVSLSFCFCWLHSLMILFIC